MLFSDLTNALGYNQSPLYREDDGEGLVALEDQHWLRSARRAKAQGTYFFKTTPDTDQAPASVRPAVHVAEKAGMRPVAADEDDEIGEVLIYETGSARAVTSSGGSA